MTGFSPKKLQVGGTVNPRQHLFIQREEVEQPLYNQLLKGEYCNVLASRQVGKSSLMKHTMRKLAAAGVRVADIDISGELGTPENATDWYLGLLGKIIRALRLTIDIESWWANAKGETANQRLMRFFAEEVFRPDNDQSQSPLVVFVDEIDATLKLPYTDDFFTAIRTMYNERGSIEVYEKVTFCLLGVATPNELIKDRRTTPFNVGTMITLRDFDQTKDNLAQLLAVLADTDLIQKTEQAQNRLTRILYWTGGHPYLTLKLCAEVLKKGLKKGLQQSAEIDTLVAGSFESFHQVEDDDHFKQITRFLGERVADQVATLGLYQRILSRRPVPDEALPAHTQLKLAGLVKADDKGNLVVRNRIYSRVFNKAWVSRTRPRRALRFLVTGSIAASVIALSVLAWNAYDRFVLQPPRLAMQEWEKRLLSTSDPVTALVLYNQINGKEIHPSLGRALTGNQQRAQNAYNDVWQRWDEHRVQILLSALNATVDEDVAWDLFKTLMGQQPEELQQRMLAGFEHRALLGYKAFWQKRAAKLLAMAKTRMAGFETELKYLRYLTQTHSAYLKYDEALIYGFAVAVKINAAIQQDISIAYLAHNYDVLQLTLRGHRGHRGLVKDATFSTDGQRIATAGFHDNTAIIWDAKTGKPQLTLFGHTRPLVPVRFSVDGSKVVTGSWDKTVRTWDTTTGKEIRVLSGHTSGVNTVAFSTDGKLVASGSNDKTVRIWSLASGEASQIFQTEGYVRQVRFAQNNQQVVAATDAARIAWDINTGTQLWTLPGFAYSLSISKDQNKLIRQANGKLDNRVKINAINDGSEINSFNIDAGKYRFLPMLEFIENDKQFVEASWNNYIQIRDIETGKQLHYLDLSYLPEVGIKRAN
ncbi:MAG: hypothetical protein ACI9FJ_003383, partial [Alteromonadaceae bacterium]